MAIGIAIFIRLMMVFRFVSWRKNGMVIGFQWVLDGEQLFQIFIYTHALALLHIQSLISETLFAKHNATSCLNKHWTQMCGKHTLCVCSLNAAPSIAENLSNQRKCVCGASHYPLRM